MKKFKIAYLIPSINSTGPVIALRDIIEATEKFTEIDIYYFDHMKNPLKLSSKTYKISFFSRIDVNKYDIIHSHMFRADLYVFINYLIIRKKWKIKFISSCHNEIEKDLKYLYGKIISRLLSPIWIHILNSFDKVVVASKFLANVNSINNFINISYIRKRYSNYLIPDVDEKKILKFIEGKIVIGYVAALIKRKNHSQIFKFLQKNTNYVGLFLGVGDEYSNMMSEIRELNIESQVLFLGYREDSKPYYKYFDIYCSPSYSEGFSLAVIDSFSNNVPVVLSNLSIWSSFIDKKEVVFFELDNENSFSNSIKYSLLNRDELSNNAFQLYNKNFTPDVVSNKYFNLYQNLTNNV